MAREAGLSGVAFIYLFFWLVCLLAIFVGGVLDPSKDLRNWRGSLGPQSGSHCCARPSSWSQLRWAQSSNQTRHFNQTFQKGLVGQGAAWLKLALSGTFLFAFPKGAVTRPFNQTFQKVWLAWSPRG